MFSTGGETFNHAVILLLTTTLGMGFLQVSGN